MISVMHQIKRPAAIVTGLSCALNLYVLAAWIYAFNSEENYKRSTQLFEQLVPFTDTYFALALCLLIFFSFIYLVRWIEEKRLLKMFLVLFQSAALAVLVFSAV
jgi:formate hydrogenlyase subunit 3/multisubunit Na+/H+ antiporter MnhD subunit